MKRSLWMCLLVLASGCAVKLVPTRLVSTNWTTVVALAPGTEVGVLLDGDQVHYGRVHEVDADALTLWERRGRTVLPRRQIQRLALRTSIGTSRAPRIIQTAVIGAVIGGTLAYLAGATRENPGPDGTRWAALFGATALGAGLGSQRLPVEQFREQLVYVRP